jgi:hypothetical protein
MKNKIAILIPTKGRLELFKQFSNSWEDTTEGLSDVIVGLDDGDTSYDSLKTQFPFVFEYCTPANFLHVLNELAVKYANQYKYIAFMEDDCTFNTPGWESKFIEKLNTLGPNGIVWGNDLLNGSKLVGLPFMNSSIVQKLGFISPPQIKCLWADYFWKAITETFNSGHYFHDVVIEHKHYSTGKSEKDSISDVIDIVGKEDYLSYRKYESDQMQKDLSKLR